MSRLRTRVASLLIASLALPAAAEDSRTQIQPGHNLLGEAAASRLRSDVRVEGLSFRTLDGRAIYLTDAVADGPVAFAFLSTTCPLAKRYTSRLNQLHDAFSDRGVQLYGVFSNSDETRESIEAYLEKVQFPFAVIRDVGGYVASRMGATMTPQAVVVDPSAMLRYRGPIDDNRYETRVKKRYLAEALEAVLADTAVACPSIKSIGCTIHRDSPSEQEKITYTQHVARILQDNCQSCHRPGQVAPFPLTNYDEARRWRTEIKEYTKARLMPPWKAEAGFGDFKDDVSLTAEEIAVIGRWVDQGTPLGDPADMPPTPRFDDSWAFGEPDLIVEMPEEYVIGPEGEDDYRHFIIPYEAAQARFIEAVDVRPGNRSIVHHVIGYVDTSGKARELDAADPGPGYTRFGDVGFDPASSIGGWAPGNRPGKTPPGTGRWLPKKCDIVLQVHYYRSGVEETDRTKVGVYFSRAPRPVPIRVGVAINHDFVLKAGKETCTVRAAYEVKKDSYLFEVTPHMHLLGKTMEVTATLPNGDTLPIVRINDWDFNWQITYKFRELQYLPAGTRVQLVATFDNSAGNPNNPHDPPIDVAWGEKTTDEMCIAFLGLIRKSEYDPRTKARRGVEQAKATRSEAPRQAQTASE